MKRIVLFVILVLLGLAAAEWQWVEEEETVLSTATSLEDQADVEAFVPKASWQRATPVKKTAPKPTRPTIGAHRATPNKTPAKSSTATKKSGGSSSKFSLSSLKPLVGKIGGLVKGSSSSSSSSSSGQQPIQIAAVHPTTNQRVMMQCTVLGALSDVSFSGAGDIGDASNTISGGSTSSTPSSSQQDDLNGEACWKNSYGRGAGSVLSTCPSGTERNGALCYPLCRAGFSGSGPVCWQTCPSGFRNDGAYCGKPSSYGRGAGYAIWDENKCKRENHQGCEKNGAMWYPKCRNGFHNVGCCVCSPNCINGMKDIGVSCQKQSYGRSAGKPMICASNTEQNGALCYPRCRSGYNGVGPVCWGSCPSFAPVECGAMCVKSANICTSTIKQMAQDALSAAQKFAGEDYAGGAIAVGNFATDFILPKCP